MASLGKQISILFLVLLPSFFQVQARESLFFSKFAHLTSSQNVVPPVESPALAPSPAPSPASSDDIEPQNPNYGLYGREAGSDDLPAAMTTPTTTTNKNDLMDERLFGESGVTGYEKNNYRSNRYFTNNNDDNGYYYNNNRYEADERQGMSDTRFMEGGRYHYDLDSERKAVRNNYEGYYQTSQNFNNFNSMNRFENQQDRFYEEDQEEILP